MTRSRRPRHRGKGEQERPAQGKAAPAAAPEAKLAEPQVPVAIFKAGQRVRFCEPFRPSGSRCMTGTILRAGELVDVRWDDGRTSHMMSGALVELHVDEEGPETDEPKPA